MDEIKSYHTSNSNIKITTYIILLHHVLETLWTYLHQNDNGSEHLQQLHEILDQKMHGKTLNYHYQKSHYLETNKEQD